MLNMLMYSMIEHFRLAAGIGYGVFRPEVIGDLPAEEARTFFSQHALARAGKDLEVTDNVWEQVHQVGTEKCVLNF